MSEEKRKVLEMLEAGTITQGDAVRLLEALGESDGQEPAAPEVPETPPVPEAPEAPRAPEKQIPRLTIDPGAEWEKLSEKIVETANRAVETANRAAEAAARVAEPVGQAIGEAIVEGMDGILNGELFGWSEEKPENYTESLLYVVPQSETPLSAVRVNWIAGPVELRRGEDHELHVAEYSTRPLSEEEKLEFHLDDGELEIRWVAKERERRGLFGKNPFKNLQKKLVVELPVDLEGLEELEVKCVSGSITADGLSGHEIELNSESGRVNASCLSGGEIELNSVSGSVVAAGITAEELDARSTSGQVFLQGVSANELNVTAVSGEIETQGFSAGAAEFLSTSGAIVASGTAEEMNARSVSGEVKVTLLSLPKNAMAKTTSGHVILALPDTPEGFTVNYKTNSGSFRSEFPLTGRMDRKSGECTCGQGSADIEMKTMSGRMELRRVPQ